MIDESATEFELKMMWDVAKIIRKDILKEKWKFNGDLNNFTAPHLLSTFPKWVLIGTKNRNSEGTNTRKVESEMAVITQMIMLSVKTPRPASCESTNANCNTYQRIKTPLSVGVGLYLYHATRSKKRIKFFSDFNIGINYYKVIGINQDISNSIIEKCKENNVVFLRSTLSKNRPVFFAIDNTDLRIDTFDGRNQLHGTAIAVYQTTNGDKKHEVKAHLLLHFVYFQVNKCKLQV